MDSKNRMEGCVCADGAKVAEIVHPYCPAHVPPEMEAELASLRAEVARLKARPVVVPGDVRKALDVLFGLLPATLYRHERSALTVARAWLASLPGGGKEPDGFCACGRRTSECDRSRKACISESR